MRYLLLLKDKIIAQFCADGNYISDIVPVGVLPMGYNALEFPKWLYNRTINCQNSALSKWLQANSANTIEAVIELSHSVSMCDCYWVRQVGEELSWKDVSPYSNNPNPVISLAAFDESPNMRVCNRISPEPSTAGTFPKYWMHRDNTIRLRKRGGEMFGSKGREPYCEVLASQVYTKLQAGIPYSLDTIDGVVVSECEAFTSETLSFIAYGDKYSDTFSTQAVLDKYQYLHKSELIKRIYIAAALTYNVDMHGLNFGFITDSKTPYAPKQTAPGFDYNLSMLSRCDFEDLESTFEYARSLKSHYGEDFINIAKLCMTDEIYQDLLNLRGIELTLPFYTDRFPEQYARWLTDIVNSRIDEVIKSVKPVHSYHNIEQYRRICKISDSQWNSTREELYKEFGVDTLSALNEKLSIVLPKCED